jgi:hypothetical protein
VKLREEGNTMGTLDVKAGVSLPVDAGFSVR